MNIKDILNRDLINLTNCESEPIHVPGSIQPHGFLFAVQPTTQIIDYCSANCSSLAGFAPQHILGKPLSVIFSQDQVSLFEQHIKNDELDNAQPFVFTLNQTHFNTSVHKSGNLLILELEPFPNGALDLPNLYRQTSKFVSLMEGTSKLLDLFRDMANETRSITGYDRVMIYRFDQDYNGEVVAESKREDLVSFSGQKYPHTDIPAQARELYIRNPIRMIADVNYEPVPLLTLDQQDERNNTSIDLSLSVLRSVSPIHIEYLKNMGVGATLTISLLKDQKLWGLISCHHYSPKILPHYTRLAALLQGRFLSSQISVREVAEEFEVAQAVESSLLEALDLLQNSDSFLENFHTFPATLQIANASGVIVFHDGNIYKNGLVPPDAEMRDLIQWLSKNHTNNHLHTSSLRAIYSDGPNLSNYAAGLIYYAMPACDCIIWLRPEVVQMNNWAGNPHKAVVMNEEGFRLSPRKSFELWMEVVKDKSDEWKKSELNAASNFTHALQKQINLHFVRSQEEKYRMLSNELTAANKELANLNWISTHDLKEPLRKIQIFASKVLDLNNPDVTLPIRDSVTRMRFAAQKMQRLIEDILSYSRAASMEKVFEKTDLAEILQNVLLELEEEITEKSASVTFDQLPVIMAVPFQINQLFMNLISNAMKFVEPGSPPQIHIGRSVVTGEKLHGHKLSPNRLFEKIAISDNGIGFEENFYGRIFEVFQRLHPANTYPGTGIGLAICKKIVENHHGAITVASQPGKGSVFTIYLPAS